MSCILTFFGTLSAQNALNFDGVDDYVQTNFSGVLSSNNRTFEAWVNVSPNAPNANLTILDYGLNAVGSRNTFMINAIRGLGYFSGGTNANISTTSVVIQAGQWTHVAFVLDNGTGYLYVNGIQSGTGSLTSVNTPSGNAKLTIGQRVSGGSIPFSGGIDELRVWNVAKTQAEIVASMNSELCTHPTSLLAYYKLNQGLALGNNVGLTNVIGALGDTAVAQNFAMTGQVSNWITGAGINAMNPLDFGISIDTLNQTLTSNDTSSNIHYQWYDCIANSILVGDTGRTLVSRSGGTYAVILSNTVCTDTSACVSLSSSGGGTIPGEALYFDGVDDYVQTSFPGILDSNNRTFEAWVNVSPNAPSANLTILDYGLNTVGSRNTFMVNSSRGLGFISGGTNANLNTSSGLIQTNQWTHVAFVLNNGTGYLYINGVQSVTGSLSSVNTPAGNTNLIIGERIPGGSVPFSGGIDELRIWNVARTQAEIVANMNVEFCGPTPGLVAHFNMNNGIAGGNNTSIIKVFNSVNSGDGILSNFALTGTSSNFNSPGSAIQLPLIDTTISQNGVNLMANDTTADRYQWIDCSNNTVIIGDTTSSFIATANGNYAVVLSKNGCSDTSGCIQIIGVGIDETQTANNFYLSQNPVQERFQLINKNSVKVNVSIRSITGSIVYKKLQVSDHKIDFNLSDVKTGIYILTVEELGGLIQNFKIIKQ